MKYTVNLVLKLFFTFGPNLSYCPNQPGLYKLDCICRKSYGAESWGKNVLSIINVQLKETGHIQEPPKILETVILTSTGYLQ